MARWNQKVEPKSKSRLLVLLFEKGIKEEGMRANKKIKWWIFYRTIKKLRKK
jgi:hypothetical protein